jgi:ubiquinone/menaquinone biosynthesis C-methylase UbiE
MIATAHAAVAEAAVENVSLIQAEAENLPLPSESIDVGVVNGLFNLVHHKGAAASELHRVLRPDGRVVGAEIVITDERPPGQLDLEAWFR